MTAKCVDVPPKPAPITVYFTCSLPSPLYAIPLRFVVMLPHSSLTCSSHKQFILFMYLSMEYFIIHGYNPFIQEYFIHGFIRFAFSFLLYAKHQLNVCYVELIKTFAEMAQEKVSPRYFTSLDNFLSFWFLRSGNFSSTLTLSTTESRLCL